MGSSVEHDSLEKLERRIEDLLAVCRRLKSENRMLKSSQKTMAEAHERLTENSRRARERVELMISRLKALERSQ